MTTLGRDTVVSSLERNTNDIRTKCSFGVRCLAGVCRVDVDSPGGVMKGWWILPSGLIGLSLLACWLVYVVVLK